MLIGINAGLYSGQHRIVEILSPKVFLEPVKFCKSEKYISPEGDKEQAPDCILLWTW